MVKSNWNFLVAATTTTNGIEYRNANSSSSTTVSISLAGTSTSYSVVFEAKGLLGDYVPIYAWDESNKTMVSTATYTDGKLFTVDITGKDYFRIRISAIGNGNLSASGKVVE